MVYLDSEDLCYRENVVIAKAMSKYGSESYHTKQGSERVMSTYQKNIKAINSSRSEIHFSKLRVRK
jgi:hypothetical protein